MQESIDHCWKCARLLHMYCLQISITKFESSSKKTNQIFELFIVIKNLY